MAMVIELLGPPTCIGCRAHGALLCRSCRLRVPPAPRGGEISGVRRVLAAWAYEGAARSLILELKLQGRRAAAVPLVEAIGREVGRQGLDGEIVTWVPGRRADTRRRGFNHAELLARGVAGRLGLQPRDLLSRTSVRRDQAGLSAVERRVNLTGAFVSQQCRAPVILVDDLVTTGATAVACASALAAAGVPSVELLVACRA